MTDNNNEEDKMKAKNRILEILANKPKTTDEMIEERERLKEEQDEANMHLFTHTFLEVHVRSFYNYLWPVGYPQFEMVFEKEVGVNLYDNIETYHDDLDGYAFIKKGFNRDIDKNGDLLEKLMPFNIGPFYVYYDVLIYGCNHDASVKQNIFEFIRVTPRGIR
jgi:nucleoside-specific outer membrane channel protein Tsx